ncbi:hypothetical protein BASA81_016715 [Batrachochytrium salamandrivorans]|nr:hypothetical protein BASA81_016715 [Batrachochytrium salamandrivorans]
MQMLILIKRDCRKGSDGETSRNPRKEESEGKSGHVANKRKASNDEDSRILQALFSKTGVHSALQHDVIMDASSPEALIVEREASKVADEAIAALKKADDVYSIAEITLAFLPGLAVMGVRVLQWPGLPLVALAHLVLEPKTRAIRALDTPSLATPSAFILPGSAFATAMASASSDSVTDAPSADSVPVFRKMLKGIAEFTKDERGVGLWRLKDEFM